MSGFSRARLDRETDNSLIPGAGNPKLSSRRNFGVILMSFKRFFLISAVLATFLGGSGLGMAQPTLSVSPSVISNTYPGFITLSITGVTNGEKVTVQKWLDQNGNGLIDPGETMIDAFKIADGSAMVISGITNLNAPFDSNPAAGAITTTLNCPAALLLDNMVGHFVYRVISSGGSATAMFTVTNAILGQSVSGIIYSNDGVTPLPYAIVVAEDQQANNPAGAVVADGTGHYFLEVNPSSYNLMAARPNYYFNQKLAPSVLLTNGMSATNNLTLTNGTVTISGSVYDAGNSSGIGGLLMQVQSGKQLFAVTFTDTNGNYTAAVSPSTWAIQPVKQRLARRAYVVPQATFQVDATGGSVSNANIALPKGNALFYGRITDNSNVPFANIEIDGSTGNGSTSNSYDAKGYSDANGNYTVAVLGGGTNWSDSANDGKNTAIANYILNVSTNPVFAVNQVVLQNFVALPATATISGHVQDNSGTNVVGVGLNATAVIGGYGYQSEDATTDNSGNYSLAVAAGTWDVEFFTGDFSDSLGNHGYADLFTPHYVPVPPTNATLNITVYPIGTPQISGPGRFSPTQFGFSVSGAVGVNYTVQVSTNLAATNWANVTTFQLTSNYFPIVDSQATNSSRFYRVLKN